MYRSPGAVIPDVCFPDEQLGLRKDFFSVRVLLITHTPVDRDPKAWIEDEDEARRVSQTFAVRSLYSSPTSASPRLLRNLDDGHMGGMYSVSQ